MSRVAPGSTSTTRYSGRPGGGDRAEIADAVARRVVDRLQVPQLRAAQNQGVTVAADRLRLTLRGPRGVISERHRIAVAAPYARDELRAADVGSASASMAGEVGATPKSQYSPAAVRPAGSETSMTVVPSWRVRTSGRPAVSGATA